MSEWWSYTLADFLLFSPRTYYRLLELYNRAIWPAQLAGVTIGLTILVLAARSSRSDGRVIAGLLAVCWLWVAWMFHFHRYAQINWAAPWFAVAFALQASLLVVLGVLAGRIVMRPSHGGERKLALTLGTLVVVAYPLLAPIAGRAWTTAEAFGTAADPTAIATIAVLALVDGRVRWLLLIVPLLWCVVAAATLWAMGSWEAIVMGATALLALLPAWRGSRRAPWRHGGRNIR